MWRSTFCRAFFGWRRGGDRSVVARRVTAPVTERWIGRNRHPAVGLLWALHCGRTALAGICRGGAGRLAPPAAGGDGREGGRARREDGRRRSPPRRLREQRTRAWRTSMRESRRIRARTPPSAGGVVGRLHACVAAGTLAQRPAGQRLIIPIVGDGASCCGAVVAACGAPAGTRPASAVGRGWRGNRSGGCGGIRAGARAAACGG